MAATGTIDEHLKCATGSHSSVHTRGPEHGERERTKFHIELSWEEVDMSLAGLVFLPIRETIKK